MGINVLHGTSVEKNTPPSMPTSPKVVLKGTHKGKEVLLGLEESVLSKHMMLIGGTGSGKSTLFYHIIKQLKQDMTKDDVMIVFDAKGDYYQRFYESGDCVIGNSQEYFATSERWNIFREMLADGHDDQMININTSEICKALFSERVKNSTNTFFPNAARDLLAAVLVNTIRLANYNKNFCDQLYNSRIREYLDSSSREKLYDYLDSFADLKSVLSYIGGDNAQSWGVLAEMMSVVRDTFMGVFCEKGQFSIRGFVRAKGGKTLFLEYDLALGGVLTPVYKLLIDLALKEALGRSKSSGNVYIVCDEFKLLPDLQHIEDAVNFGRSLGVKVFAGLQSIEQLRYIYGEKRGNSIAAGFATVIAFRANDEPTRKFISGLYGENMLLEQYPMLNKQRDETARIGLTVEEWDLMSLCVGEAVVGLPMTPPFRFYFEE